MEYSPFQQSQDVAGTARAEDYSSFGQSTFAIEKQRIKDDLWWEQMKQMIENITQHGIEEAESQWGRSDTLSTVVNTVADIAFLLKPDAKLAAKAIVPDAAAELTRWLTGGYDAIDPRMPGRDAIMGDTLFRRVSQGEELVDISEDVSKSFANQAKARQFQKASNALLSMTTKGIKGKIEEMHPTEPVIEGSGDTFSSVGTGKFGQEGTFSPAGSLYNFNVAPGKYTLVEKAIDKMMGKPSLDFYRKSLWGYLQSENFDANTFTGFLEALEKLYPDLVEEFKAVSEDNGN
jgi:hypothetical protein